jgi:outer membrane protein assembly factor BamB
MPNLTILQTYPAPARGPAGLAWDGRHLWNTDYSTAKIFCLQPDTAQPIRSFNCPGSLSGLAWDGRSLWQLLHMDGWIRRINPETGDIDQTIELPDHGWLSGAAWDGQHLWVASQQNAKLFALDTQDGRIVRTIPAPIAAGGLTYHNGHLWLGFPYPMTFNQTYGYFDWQSEEQHFAIAQIEPATGREVERHPTDFLPMGLAFANGDLWLAHASAAKLYRARLSPT